MSDPNPTDRGMDGSAASSPSDLHLPFSTFRQGRNLQGKPVMGAACCTEVWMTSYRPFRGWLGARRYLRGRYDAHVQGSL